MYTFSYNTGNYQKAAGDSDSIDYYRVFADKKHHFYGMRMNMRLCSLKNTIPPFLS
jgi:hypothetical protein